MGGEERGRVRETPQTCPGRPGGQTTAASLCLSGSPRAVSRSRSTCSRSHCAVSRSRGSFRIRAHASAGAAQGVQRGAARGASPCCICRRCTKLARKEKGPRDCGPLESSNTLLEGDIVVVERKGGIGGRCRSCGIGGRCRSCGIDRGGRHRGCARDFAGRRLARLFSR